jgi:hypothetical protein
MTPAQPAALAHVSPTRACYCLFLRLGFRCFLQPIGRSVDETLRLVQAIQFHAKYGEVSSSNFLLVFLCVLSNPVGDI